MALIEFKNLPNTDTPINADNLNNNFKEVNHEDIVTNGGAVKCGYKIDGKDVYCKIVYFDAPNATSLTISSGITSYDKIWIDESNSFIDGSYESMGINSYGTDGYARCWYNKTNNNIRFNTSWNLSTRKCYVCLKYTEANKEV